MEVEKWELHSVAVVTLYDKIDLDQISRDELRGLLKDAEKPMLTEFPDGPIVLFYQNVGIQCIIHGRRTEVKDRGAMAIGRRPISYMVDITLGVRSHLPNANVVAYGFNYDIAIKLKNVLHIGEYLRDTFLREIWREQERLGGPLRFAAVRLGIDAGDHVEYNLNLRAQDVDPSTFLVGINAHFPQGELPSAAEMQDRIHEHYRRLKALISQI